MVLGTARRRYTLEPEKSIVPHADASFQSRKPDSRARLSYGALTYPGHLAMRIVISGGAGFLGASWRARSRSAALTDASGLRSRFRGRPGRHRHDASVRDPRVRAVAAIYPIRRRVARIRVVRDSVSLAAVVSGEASRFLLGSRVNVDGNTPARGVPAAALAAESCSTSSVAGSASVARRRTRQQMTRILVRRAEGRWRIALP